MLSVVFLICHASILLTKMFCFCVKKKRAHEVMKWRQTVRLNEKQEAEREAVESKIQEHLKVLQYYIVFI